MEENNNGRIQTNIGNVIVNACESLTTISTMLFSINGLLEKFAFNFVFKTSSEIRIVFYTINAFNLLFHFLSRIQLFNFFASFDGVKCVYVLCIPNQILIVCKQLN